MNWFLMALKKYSDFSGRAQRSEYWFFTLFYVLIYIGIAIVEGVLGTRMILTGLLRWRWFYRRLQWLRAGCTIPTVVAGGC